MNSDYYEILGVDSTASAREIKRAYRRRSSQWHPDKWIGHPVQEMDDAEAIFKDIEEAYRVLKDPINRAHYDQTGEGNMPKSKDIAVKKIIALFQKHIKEALEAELKGETVQATMGSAGMTFFRMQDAGTGMERLLATMRLELKTELKKTEAVIKGLTDGVAKLNKYKRRIVSKGTTNLFLGVIEQQLKATQGALASSGIEKIALETALASLDDYSFVLDENSDLLIEDMA